jgi:hypothetical protein
MSILSTERGPSNLTLKHDRTQAPPVTIRSVTVATENFWSYVVRGSDGRIRHNSPRLSPIIDHAAVAYSKVDLVKVDGIAIGGTARLSLEQLLVVGIVMQLMKASRQTEISKFDVSTPVKQDIVWLDITVMN